MTIELEVPIRRAVSLADVLANAARMITTLPRASAVPLVMSSLAVTLSEGSAATLTIGPFPVVKPAREPRRPGYINPLTIWKPRYVEVSAGEIATVGLAVGHMLTSAERGLSTERMTDADRADEVERSGYRAMIDAGIFRSRSSFVLGVLLAWSIADLNGTRVIDDSGRLKSGEAIEPDVLRALFARHAHSAGDVSDFEELSDRLCDDIGFTLGA